MNIKDFNAFCFNISKWLNQKGDMDILNNKAFWLIIKINGETVNNNEKNQKGINIFNEIIELRVVTISKIKSVYMRFSEKLFDYFFNDMKNSEFYKDRFRYVYKFWYKSDSFIINSFNFLDYFSSECEIEIIGMGTGISYLNTEKLTFKQKEESLLNDFKEIDNWDVNTENNKKFINSLLRELSIRHYVNGFKIKLINNENNEENKSFLSYNEKDGYSVVTLSIDKKNNLGTFSIYSLTKEISENLCNNRYIDYVTDDNSNIIEFLNSESETLINEGYNISIKQIKTT
ncbi:MAG: hypothetical protein K0R54_1802 [Clostridiaceae bacterium]|jgi:hypothetical protein|nr:hypothetical protein [Clostridiaceae bacterium]